MTENQIEITLGVLNAVEGNRNVAQRVVAKDLGVALGLVNSYLKRCIRKGFVKTRRAPANRHSGVIDPGLTGQASLGLPIFADVHAAGEIALYRVRSIR